MSKKIEFANFEIAAMAKNDQSANYEMPAAFCQAESEAV
jgi:hypothetical protein